MGEALIIHIMFEQDMDIGEERAAGDEELKRFNDYVNIYLQVNIGDSIN